MSPVSPFPHLRYKLTVMEEVFAIRFFLGIFEAAMLPGVLFYLSTFYKRNELASRLGIFYGNGVPSRFGCCLTSAFSYVRYLGCFLW